jgi:hypothetical protein
MIYFNISLFQIVKKWTLQNLLINYLIPMNLSICHSIECVSCIGRRFIKTKILLLHSNLDVSAENKAYIRCLAYHDIKCDYKFSNTTSRENLILIFNHLLQKHDKIYPTITNDFHNWCNAQRVPRSTLTDSVYGRKRSYTVSYTTVYMPYTLRIRPYFAIKHVIVLRSYMSVTVYDEIRKP